MFGAGGRINRAEYWLSIFEIYSRRIVRCSHPGHGSRNCNAVSHHRYHSRPDPLANVGPRHPHRTAARPQQERLVAIGILRNTRRYRSSFQRSVVSRKCRSDAALRPRAGGLRTYSLGVCRNWLSARDRRGEQIWSDPPFAIEGPATRYWFAAPAALGSFPNAPASASAAIR